MKVFSGLPRVFRSPGPVVAIGVFDGVHSAHRRILTAAAAKAEKSGGTSVVLTFYPHPQKQKSLYSLEHRIKLIAECGIDVCVVLDFSSSLSGLPAEEFLARIVRGRIGARYVYVGDNFRFGKGAACGVGLLKTLGRKLGLTVRVFPRMRCGGRPVSSTSIRRSILSGRLVEAERMLGRPVSVYGTVVEGDRFGRQIGFPTANIDPHHEILPPPGVYAVNVLPDAGIASRPLGGVCYIGRRPTLKKDADSRVEAHIFGCARDLYGRNLLINFLSLIRRDRKFPSVGALRKQIAKDIEKAGEWLKDEKAVQSKHTKDEGRSTKDGQPGAPCSYVELNKYPLVRT